jgi:hypothetical protein
MTVGKDNSRRQKRGKRGGRHTPVEAKEFLSISRAIISLIPRKASEFSECMGSHVSKK